MKRKVFQININTDVLKKLRDIINSEIYISQEKEYKGFRAWDKICAIMDRLDDTVDYLNQIELNTGKYTRSAFDFYDFMNNASVVVDCVKEFAKVFEVSLDKIKYPKDIFNEVGTDGKGTDEKYFEYLRSLCSVHPVETSRHERYQDNKFECCPFVNWDNNSLSEDDSDIYAMVYTSKNDEYCKTVSIRISKIFEYVKTRVEFVNEIIKSIQQYQNKFISNFIQQPIKKEEDFKDYTEYLKNLICESRQREGEKNLYEYVIQLLELKISNPDNEKKVNLYKNALKYAIKFEYNRLQNMSSIGFANNGIKYPDEQIETTLYSEIISCNSESQERRKYSYNLEKIEYLYYNTSDSNRRWGYIQLKNAIPFLGKYISFDGAKGDFENYILVMVALYLECLENNCLLNKNIPNDLNYREKLLNA